MSPFAAWLIGELTKLTVQRLADAGKLDSLTEDEAKAKLAELNAALEPKLPSPQELENGA